MKVKNLVVVWHKSDWPWASEAYETDHRLVNNIEVADFESVTVDVYNQETVLYKTVTLVYGLRDENVCFRQITNLPIAQHTTLKGGEARTFLEERGLI